MNLIIRKRHLWHLSYLWILLAVPLGAATARIYVMNLGGTSISVIDPETNKVVQVIEGIEVPEAAQFSPDGSRVYVTTASENVLIVVDRATGRQIKKVPLSGRANDLAVTKDGKRVLVCIAESPGALDIIDTASLTKVKTVPAKSRMHDIVVTNDGKYAVAGSPEGKVAIVYDLQTEQPAWEVQLDRGVMPITLEHRPNGSASRIFVELNGLDGFAAIDFDKRQESARVRLPEPRQTGGFGRRSDTSHGIGVAPDNKTLWVVSRVSNAVYSYSLPDLKLLGQVPLPVLQLPGRAPIGASPHWITFTPDSKTVYVSNDALKTVVAIDVQSRKEVARIPVGETPRRMSTLVLP
ncbi:MAG: YncE family protein [Terriglobia bacterium]